MVYVVADIGTNWMGDIRLAKNLIADCLNIGVDAVKFQMWEPTDLYNETHEYWEMINQSELTVEVAKILKDYANGIGIEWFTSTFYPECIDELAAMGVSYFKLAGCVTTTLGMAANADILHGVQPYGQWYPLFERMLERMAEYPSIPVFASLNGYKATVEALNNQHDAIRARLPENELIWLLTHSAYPLTVEELHFLNQIRFGLYAWNPNPGIPGCEIDWAGFSDHTTGSEASLFAVAREATVIERHVGPLEVIEKLKTPDAAVSITIGQLATLINQIRVFEKFKRQKPPNSEEEQVINYDAGAENPNEGRT